MIILTATEFRKNLSACLDRVSAGETIVIRRNGREAARLVPCRAGDWRGRMTVRPVVLVPDEALIETMDDFREENPLPGLWP
ncbi:type II toxin-antitoxin system Phd/YefM family antitoxin [bacterium]|nr:type II toxin-antitoxin system Phd/YefM family antitoxin [bacterium]